MTFFEIWFIGAVACWIAGVLVATSKRDDIDPLHFLPIFFISMFPIINLLAALLVFARIKGAPDDRND